MSGTVYQLLKETTPLDQLPPWTGEGSDADNAPRWLRSFDLAVDRSIRPRGVDRNMPRGIDLATDEERALVWITCFDLILTKTAATWADTDPVVKRILEPLRTRETNPVFTRKDVDTVVSRFHARFPGFKSSIPQDWWMNEIEELEQRKGETLLAYYRRTEIILLQIGGKDASVGGDDDPLSTLEDTWLKRCMMKFVRGLTDRTLANKFIPKIESIRSFSDLFAAVVAEAKVMKILQDEKMVETIIEAIIDPKNGL